MIVYCVEVYVKTGFENEFIDATRKNHNATRKEDGNLRFDLSQSADNSCLFFLYEVYRDENAVKAHKSTDHYALWRETVAPWMDKTRYGRMFVPVVPEKENNW